jgi:hypothetical protein
VLELHNEPSPREGPQRNRGFSGAAGVDDIDETIELLVRVRVRGSRHPIPSPAHVWIPHPAPEAGHVIGDRVFRSPAIVLSDPTIALAFIPDLDDVSAADGWRAWMDYDHPRSKVTLGGRCIHRSRSPLLPPTSRPLGRPKRRAASARRRKHPCAGLQESVRHGRAMDLEAVGPPRAGSPGATAGFATDGSNRSVGVLERRVGRCRLAIDGSS